MLRQAWICERVHCGCADTCYVTGQTLPLHDRIAEYAFNRWAQAAYQILENAFSENADKLLAAGTNPADFLRQNFRANTSFTANPDRWMGYLVFQAGPQPDKLPKEFELWRDNITEALQEICQPFYLPLKDLGFDPPQPIFRITARPDSNSDSLAEDFPESWQGALRLRPQNDINMLRCIKMAQVNRDTSENSDNQLPNAEALLISKYGPGREGSTNKPELPETSPATAVAEHPMFQAAAAYAGQCLTTAWRLRQAQEHSLTPDYPAPPPEKANAYLALAVTTLYQAFRTAFRTYAGAEPDAVDYLPVVAQLTQSAETVSGANSQFLNSLYYRMQRELADHQASIAD